MYLDHLEKDTCILRSQILNLQGGVSVNILLPVETIGHHPHNRPKDHECCVSANPSIESAAC